MAHKDICEKFEVEDEETGEIRRFEAVGFLCERERYVSAYELLKRTAGENGGAIGEDDWEFLSKHLDKFPDELYKYALVTKCAFSDRPYEPVYFGWHGIRQWWFQFWVRLGNQWGSNSLVVRRCA